VSQDKDSKTEEPTPKKLRDARKKGQIARSDELVPLMMILLAILYFWFAWDSFSGHIKEYMIAVSEFSYDRDFQYALDATISIWFNKIILGLMLPFSALMLVAGILGNVIQFGFLFSLDPIIPKPEKINPIAGFKRIFSMKQVVKTILSVIKIVAMSIIVIFVVRTAISEYMHDIGQCNTTCQFEVFVGMLKKMFFILVPVLIMMAMLDLMYQKFQYKKEQRMSKDEVKREYKNQEGDPLIKGQRKSEQRRLLEQNISDQIKQSRILIVGMRKAVALMYEEDMPLPMLLAIGRERLSMKMIEVAKKENVPIIADPALVMIFEKEGVIDQYIPSSAIKRVAQAMKRRS